MPGHYRPSPRDSGHGSAKSHARATGYDEDQATGGRGLRIVGVLADRWGHASDKLGCVAWFELTAKPDD